MISKKPPRFTTLSLHSSKKRKEKKKGWMERGGQDVFVTLPAVAASTLFLLYLFCFNRKHERSRPNCARIRTFSLKERTKICVAQRSIIF